MKIFLSCDWGTSNFRLRLVDVNTGKIFQEVSSDQGIANTYKAWIDSGLPANERIYFYRKVLHDAILKLSPESFDKNVQIIISGMASSSIGMQELPYAKFPLRLNANQLTISKIESNNLFTHPICLVSGCCTDRDIMRGEETILLGCDGKDKNEAVYIFPGTHSKHVTVSNGIALDFKTYVTGELFNLLAQKSILSNSVSEGEDKESFVKGIIDAQNENILNSIFSIRASHILHHTSPVENYQYLSGLIIGTELKQLKNFSSTIYIVSEDPLMQRYNLGLRTIGVRREVICKSANVAFVNGQRKVMDSLENWKV